ncbi:unnamed protein product, partial [Prorocentrum cordatum]
ARRSRKGEKIQEAEKTLLKLDPTYAKRKGGAIVKAIDGKFNEFIAGQRALVGDQGPSSPGPSAETEGARRRLTGKGRDSTTSGESPQEKRILTSLQRRLAAAELGHYVQLTTGALEEFQTACEERWANRAFLKLINRLFETYTPDVKPPRYKGERILT